MSDLLHIVKGLSVQPKCVVVLGARIEAVLNWLFSLTASQVVLVEPELAMFEKAGALHSAKGKPDNVSIIHGVPAFETEQKTTPYFTSNVLGFSSVLPPNLIKSIRPALEFTEQEVPIVALKPLLKQFNISESEPCLLIAQLNGGEQESINPQILNTFTHIVIQSSLKPVFGEIKAIEKLKRQLVECGRDYIELAESMPPYTSIITCKKINTTEAMSYFSQRRQHRETKEKLENELLNLNLEIEQLSTELQKVKRQYHENKKDSFNSLEEKALLIEKLNEKILDSKEQIERLQKKLVEKEIEAKDFVDKNLKVVEVTNKLNLKLQTDLDNLRQKYFEKTSSEEELIKLVEDLYKKLKEASETYYALKQQSSDVGEKSDD